MACRSQCACDWRPSRAVKDGMLGSGIGPEFYKEDNHDEDPVHKTYVKIRAKLDELKAAPAARRR